jgi:hypothetical protein
MMPDPRADGCGTRKLTEREPAFVIAGMLAPAGANPCAPCRDPSVLACSPGSCLTG